MVIEAFLLLSLIAAAVSFVVYNDGYLIMLCAVIFFAFVLLTTAERGFIVFCKDKQGESVKTVAPVTYAKSKDPQRKEISEVERQECIKKFLYHQAVLEQYEKSKDGKIPRIAFMSYEEYFQTPEFASQQKNFMLQQQEIERQNVLQHVHQHQEFVDQSMRQLEITNLHNAIADQHNEMHLQHNQIQQQQNDYMNQSFGFGGFGTF